MAQNFRRYTFNNIGTSAETLFTADSYDTVVGISVSNVTASASSASAAATSESNASTSETNAASSASAASTSASNASTSETNAASSATSASTSATSAATAQTAAETAQAAAELAYDNFDDRYLGPKASDPATDNDGDALIDGALYFNTTGNVLKYWDGSAWNNVEAVDTSNFATNGFSIAMAIAL